MSQTPPKMPEETVVQATRGSSPTAEPKETVPSPAPNAFVSVVRKIYHPLGFKKGYNFVLFFIFCGALVGFTLARLTYIDYNNVLCKPDEEAGLPGECFWYRTIPHEKVGIIIHLATILPASLLVWLQFIPAIRYKWIMVHRANGYLVLTLSLVGTAGAFMVARHSFGGGLAVQTVIGLIGVIFVVSIALAYINIKRLQIEQHRAWMIRAWVYAGTIITLRLIAMVAMVIMSNTGGYYSAIPCKVVASMVDPPQRVARLFPACAPFISGQDPEAWTMVAATVRGANSAAMPAASAHQSYTMGGWLALFIHIVGAELYLRLTPVEAERLRQVSYQRQLEAGMKHPGNAGLTATRLGDTGHKMEMRERNDTAVSHSD